MAGVNKAIIMGSLGRDPELSYTGGNMAVCKLSIATSEKAKGGSEKTEWHRVTAWGKQAEAIAQHFSKGQMIYIEGKIVYGNYEKDGVKHYTTDIFVKEFSFCGSASRPVSQEQPRQQAPQIPRQQRNQDQVGYQEDEFGYIPPQEDDIPF